MGIAYFVGPGLSVRLDGRSLLVQRDQQPPRSLELIHLRGLALFGRVEVTTPALLALLAVGGRVVMASRAGRLRAVCLPARDRSVRARIGQHRLFFSPAAADLRAAVVGRKILAMAALLRRCDRNRPELSLRADAQILLDAARAPLPATPEALLGAEGAAARVYWSAFARAVVGPLTFAGRRSRPAPDPVNALLSLGYTLLAGEAATLLHAVGLDPAIGFYHRPFRTRPSLALDLIEPFRHAVVDRAVLLAVNQARFTQADFEPRGPRASPRLTQPALRRFVTIYEEAMLAPAETELLGPRAAGCVRDALLGTCQRIHRLCSRAGPPQADSGRSAA